MMPNLTAFTENDTQPKSSSFPRSRTFPTKFPLQHLRLFWWKYCINDQCDPWKEDAQDNPCCYAAVFALRDLDISNQANNPDDCSYDCCYHNCSPPLFIMDSAFTGSLNSMLFIAFDIVIISTIQYFVNFYALYKLRIFITKNNHTDFFWCNGKNTIESPSFLTGSFNGVFLPVEISDNFSWKICHLFKERIAYVKLVLSPKL